MKNISREDLTKIKKESNAKPGLRATMYDKITDNNTLQNTCCPKNNDVCCEPKSDDATSMSSSCCDTSSISTTSSRCTDSCCKETDTTADIACCSPSAKIENWIVGYIKTSIGQIPQVSTKLANADRLGAMKVRIGINRMNYKVSPGLYTIGNPTSESPVLVTANYKLTFDKVREKLDGENVWILILDTKGVNVWCAAGKGTFATKELLSQIAKTKISQILTKKALILPQLGATGMSAHEITKTTGFKVMYGSVRIEDIKIYLHNGFVATREMRLVKFPILDRAVLTPIEVVGASKKAIIVFGILFLLNIILVNPFGLVDFYAYAGAILAGCFFTPILLPFIPGKAFMWKGLLLGLIWAIAVNFINGFPAAPSYGIIRAIGYLFMLPAISGYYAMNFTGSSTYTSLSGVTKEMKISIPILIAMAFIGGVAILLNGFGVL